jgi:uncharacterized protein YndB with AHSA1/START domain
MADTPTSPSRAPAAPEPTGRLLDTGEDGRELVIGRLVPGPPDDVWAHLTEPARTVLWFGDRRGEGGAGRTVEVRMAFEEGADWLPVIIDACEPSRRLAVSLSDAHGSWSLEVRLREAGEERTALELVHHLDGSTGLGEIGPGWEYYLDLFTASYRGAALPEFGDYYPAQKEFYDRLGG